MGEFDFLNMFDNDRHFLYFTSHIIERLKDIGRYDLIESPVFKDISIHKLNQPAEYYPNYLSKKLHLIFVDTQFLIDKGFTKDEICATILHELGHVMNSPIEDFSSGDLIDEYYADDYVRQMGFEEGLLSCIKKLDKIEHGFYSSGRIKRIEEKETIKIGKVRHQ